MKNRTKKAISWTIPISILLNFILYFAFSCLYQDEGGLFFMITTTSIGIYSIIFMINKYHRD